MKLPQPGPYGASAWATVPGRPTGNPALNTADISRAPQPQFIPQTSVPGVGFPFPGRRESWGLTPQDQTTSGAFLPGMHSGLGEQIVLPKGDQAFENGPGQGVGETASDFLRRQAQLRLAQATDAGSWPNEGYPQPKAFQVG